MGALMCRARLFRAALFLCLAACSSQTASRVQFPTAALSEAAFGHQTVDGYLTKPEGNGPFPAVVLLHGCGGVEPKEQLWRDWFRQHRFVALSVDSFTPRGVGNICTNLGRIDLNARLADALGGLDYLAAQPFVDRDRIAVMGFSNGAIVVLNAAAPPPWLARPAGSARFRAAVAFYPECLMHMAQDDPPKIPLLILIGDADDWTLASSCRRMADLYASKGSTLKLVILPGARHGFDDPNLPPRSLPDVMNINSRTGTGATVGGNSGAATESKGLVEQFLRKTLATPVSMSVGPRVLSMSFCILSAISNDAQIQGE